MECPNGTNQDKNFIISSSFDSLKSDCAKCFGLCCVVLYFSASEGFPKNKDAGVPCINLQQDFKCSVHKTLWQKGLKGCISFDCFGAGQKVAHVTYGGRDWIEAPEFKKQMFDVFLIMRQLHEMMYYMTQALALVSTSSIHNELVSMLKETERLTNSSADSILKIDLSAHRENVNFLLLKVSQLVRAKFSRKNPSNKKSVSQRPDLIGADLRKADLRGANLRGACLIAANLSGNDLSGADLIGADMRDSDLRGSSLEDSIFLTQAQINSAKGDSNTRLPVWLTRPAHWVK